MKIDWWDLRLWVLIPFVALTVEIILMYQFIYIPSKAETEQFDKKYPPQCMIERNQTVILLSANDKMTLYHPEKICQVNLRGFPDDNGTLHYFAQYQYESQAKYNKTFSETSLNCKPKSFDNITGNFICMNGSVAQEKDIYAQ